MGKQLSLFDQKIKVIKDFLMDQHPAGKVPGSRYKMILKAYQQGDIYLKKLATECWLELHKVYSVQNILNQFKPMNGLACLQLGYEYTKLATSEELDSVYYPPSRILESLLSNIKDFLDSDDKDFEKIRIKNTKITYESRYEDCYRLCSLINCLNPDLTIKGNRRQIVGYHLSDTYLNIDDLSGYDRAVEKRLDDLFYQCFPVPE